MTRPSSTSSSEPCSPADRIPSRNWIALLVSVGAVFVVLCATFEVAYRMIGHLPEVKDDKSRWAYERKKAALSERPLVLIGDSRLQMGVDLEVFRTANSSSQVFQLAIAGGLSCLPLLADLASDDSFAGVVVCGLNSEWLGPEMQWVQIGYVDHYKRRFSPSDMANN